MLHVLYAWNEDDLELTRVAAWLIAQFEGEE